MKRVYLDSNVFISLFCTEIGRGMRGLFAEAGLFFEKIKKNNDCTIILSNLFFEEIKWKTFLDRDSAIDYFRKAGIKIDCPKESGRNAFEISKKGIHWSDAMHVKIAVESGCCMIVTFNKKDFEPASSLIQIIEPREFI